jgi:hypothetical protein
MRRLGMSPSKSKVTSSKAYGDLSKIVTEFYPNHLDLMTDLSVGALWEYHVKGPTLEDDERTVFSLRKTSEDRLELRMGNAPETPDLILYFTEDAIKELVSSPNAKTYYENYSKIMREGSGTRDLDYKVNKSWTNLVKLGYKDWANRYSFMDQIGGSKAR